MNIRNGNGADQRQRWRRRGAILVLSTFVLVMIFIFTAFVVDHGYIMVHKTRLRAAVDGAALGAAQSYGDGDTAVTDAVNEVLQANGYTAGPDTTVNKEYVSWDDSSQTYVTATHSTGNAVRVTVDFTSIPSFFGTIMGYSKYEVGAEAIAMRPSSKPRDIVMVIDCSTSMSSNMSNGQSRMENTNDAAAALVDNLRTADRVGLAVYSWKDPSRTGKSKKVQKTGRVETQLAFNHAPTRSRVTVLEDGEYTSGTNIGGGLRAGLDVFLQDSSPRPVDEDYEKVLVLMTDGQVNKAEPYPYPSANQYGVLPDPPFNGSYDDEVAVSQWADSIKARGIKLHVITLGSSSHSTLMQNAASPDSGGNTFYHHIASGSEDYDELLQVYAAIGAGNETPKLVK